MLDFEYKFRTNDTFRQEVIKAYKDFSYYNEKSKNNTKFESKRKKALLNLCKLTEYNFGVFLPDYFPKYPKNEPLSLKDYPFAYLFFANLFFGSLTCRAGRQVGKTVNLCARTIMETNVFPSFKNLTITPHPDQINTYANKMKELIESFKYFKKSTNYRQNLYYREFRNKSSIKLSNVLTDASKIRGNTTDEFILDECQDFDPALEVEVEEIQSASDTPVKIYSGTSLTVDTFLEEKYQQSSQGNWNVKCTKCGKWNEPSLDGDVLKMIRKDGPSCISCGKVLNMRNGRIIHHNESALAANLFGIHVPKIIVPSIVENPMKWNRIYTQSKKTDINSFLKEILGIPVEEGARELTEQNLIDICDLGEQKPLLEKAKNKKYYYVVSGCDWGGSEHIRSMNTSLSYTAHVVLGINLDYSFDIIHLKTYSGMDYHSIANDIVYNHKQLNGYAIGADFGVGQGYNMLIREKVPPERHWMFSNTGPKSQDVSEVKDSRYNHLSLNKTEALTRIFEAIKGKRIHCYDYLAAKDLLSHCLNCIRHPHESNTGITSMTFRRHPNKPDDILQALTLAYHIGLILIGEPIFEDRAVKRRVEEILIGRYNMDGGNAFSDMSPVIG